MSNFIAIGKSKQFYNFLRNLIVNGEYQPGDKFPSIRELAAKYDIGFGAKNGQKTGLKSAFFSPVF